MVDNGHLFPQLQSSPRLTISHPVLAPTYRLILLSPELKVANLSLKLSVEILTRLWYAIIDGYRRFCNYNFGGGVTANNAKYIAQDFV